MLSYLRKKVKKILEGQVECIGQKIEHGDFPRTVQLTYAK